MIDKCFDLGFKITSQEVIFKQDAVLQGLVPETVSNLCFSGESGHSMFITATTSVYQFFVNSLGAEPWTRQSG
ncbi:Gluconolactonase [Sulfitobacter noctilucicola]|uniref:Sugar lactone lactonase YvrE n=1 Tax=Sulfitobacter noctilucicola TaxID=1342301 RepID=A0A7W6Q4S7_9RHOB|nr:hypothetical protein [Sulfitobacter noctilucicola]KIN63538.1 Gluconolactonase [Sulfitobacter noctilucicola]MBB4174953.1 sugar lactone lactonase YvrE [Sulfitobacter noctilucicola]